MSTLRPEEVQRKAIAAGYGDRSPSNPQSVHQDDTTVLCLAQAAFKMGDWVSVKGLNSQSGFLTIEKPSEDSDKAWLGVVQHTVEQDEWVLVKTCGVGIAKVNKDADLETGDLLGTSAGKTYADTFGGALPCGRFLKRFTGDENFSYVEIGSGGTSDLSVHHHTDNKNSKVTDTTTAARKLTAPLWHVWKVTDIVFTGDPDPRLMTCLGGGTGHGDDPKEGWGWAGVIGKAAKMGFGEIGGSDLAGFQGVLGAEFELDDDLPKPRINVRSWAGYNAHDRYGMPATVVHPMRFTYCATEHSPSWHVPKNCDCTKIPFTSEDECPPIITWWSGTMKRDPFFNPATFNKTTWQQQWTPQLALSRACCDVDYASQLVTPPTPDCKVIDSTERATLEANRKILAGSYEMLFPWGYHPCPNRFTPLDAICMLVTHVQAQWLSFQRLSDAVSKALGCLDTNMQTVKNFFGTKVDGAGSKPTLPICCPATWHVPVMVNGPNNAGDCEHTICEQAPVNTP